MNQQQFMNKNNRSYTPNNKTGEIAGILDKLLMQLTPRQAHPTNNSRDTSVSPLRENQLHLKQIEIQQQNIDFLQQKIREKSVENEHLKSKQMIKQLSTQGNKFFQNSYLDTSNRSYQETSISGATPKVNKGAVHFNMYEDQFDHNTSEMAQFSQIEYELEQKTILNLLNQIKSLEEKNMKFKELISLMENQYKSKLSICDQKEKKLQSKCKFLYTTLEGKDKEIKDIIQIQSKMMQQGMKDIEEKYRKEIYSMREDIIRYKEELSQRDILLQQKTFEILAKEDTISQLKVKYLENLKQSIQKNTQNTFEEVRKSIESLLGKKEQQEVFEVDTSRQRKSINSHYKQKENNLILVQENSIVNEEAQVITQNQQDLQQSHNNEMSNKNLNNNNNEKNNNISIDFNTGMTFQQEMQSSQKYIQQQSAHETNKQSENPDQELLEQTEQEQRPFTNDSRSNMMINQIQTYSNQEDEHEEYGVNEQQQPNLKPEYQKQQTDSDVQNKNLFDKIKRSTNQIKNIQNFIKQSAPNKNNSIMDINDHSFNRSFDLKQIINQTNMGGNSSQNQQNSQDQDEEQGNRHVLRNSMNIIKQNSKDFPIKSKNVEQMTNQKNIPTIDARILENNQNVFDFQQNNNNNKYQENKKGQLMRQQSQQYNNISSQLAEQIPVQYQLMNQFGNSKSQSKLHSQTQFLQDSYHDNSNRNNSYAISKNTNNIFEEQLYSPSSSQNNSHFHLNQTMQVIQNANQIQEKCNSKLYTLKLETAQTWRDTYSNLYGKTPINKQRQKQSNNNN